MKMVALYVLAMPAVVLGFTAASMFVDSVMDTTIWNPGRTASARSSTPSPRRRTTTARRSPASPRPPTWMDTTLGIAMLVGRFFLIIPVLALAGSLARKQVMPATAGHLPDPHAAVRRAGHRRRRHRRRPDLLPGAGARPHRRAAVPVGATMQTQTPTAAEPERRTRDRGTSGRCSSPPSSARALVDSVRKLDPRVQARNPVMFVVLVGSVLTTILFLRDLGDSTGEENLFAGLVAAWLWFTVLFANFAEAMAEGRGKAQAATLRKTRAETMANRRLAGRRVEQVPSSQLTVDDVVVVSAGEMIPSDGEIIEGIASVDESAITGESAPVIREAGGDRSAVTGGTRVLSDRIVVRITARPGETFLDRMIALVEGRQPAEDPQRDRPQHPAGGAHDHLPAGHRHAAAVRHLRRRRAGRDRPRRAAGLPDPHHHRRAAVGHRHRRHGPAGAAQRARHVGPGRRGGRRLLDAAARQDRHDHARQPPGGRVPAARRRPRSALAAAAQLASLADETPEGRSIVVLAKERFDLRERDVATPRSSPSPPRPA